MTAGVLTRPTLMLNRSWQPIHVATVARALVMLWNGTARVVDPDDYQLYSWSDWSRLTPREDDLCIKTVRYPLRVPEVMVLINTDRRPKHVVTFSRRNLFKRDHHQCQYCGCKPTNDSLTIDHVVPRSQGGVSSWENCVLSCIKCNNRKANRTPDQANMPLTIAPVRPSWNRIYSTHGVHIESWSRFLSEAYWNVELEE